MGGGFNFVGDSIMEMIFLERLMGSLGQAPKSPWRGIVITNLGKHVVLRRNGLLKGFAKTRRLVKNERVSAQQIYLKVQEEYRYKYPLSPAHEAQQFAEQVMTSLQATILQ